MKVRVRFAPSPTGYLHIGSARTALFNWLYAQKTGGSLVLRIEDTDVERSTPEMVDCILEGLHWLGLTWDEGPYCQSQRLQRYRDIGRQLLKSGQAYRCFCSPEVLREKKGNAPDNREWQYDGHCRHLSGRVLETAVREQQSFAIRFKVPDKQQIQFEDQVYGSVEVDTEYIEDFVIQRRDGTPTYHLSVVTDDADMNISHVLRGSDHLTNTSKHVLLYQALQEPVPFFVHLPLILGTDKKRLSKRHGATSLLEYRNQGFLPAAIKNYLARLGGSPPGNREIFSEQELVEVFDISHINKADAVFDPKKLEWMNAKYISQSETRELEPTVRDSLRQHKWWNPAWEDETDNDFSRTIELLKPRAKRLDDFARLGQPFFCEKFKYELKAVQKFLVFDDPEQNALLLLTVRQLVKAYQQLDPFNLETTEETLRTITANQGIKAGQLIGAIRVALTGQAVSPGIFDIIVTLGQKRTLERLNRLLLFFDA